MHRPGLVAPRDDLKRSSIQTQSGLGTPEHSEAVSHPAPAHPAPALVNNHNRPRRLVAQALAPLAEDEEPVDRAEE